MCACVSQCAHLSVYCARVRMHTRVYYACVGMHTCVSYAHVRMHTFMCIWMDIYKCVVYLTSLSYFPLDFITSPMPLGLPMSVVVMCFSLSFSLIFSLSHFLSLSLSLSLSHIFHKVAAPARCVQALAHGPLASQCSCEL